MSERERLAEEQWQSFVKDKACCTEHAVKHAFSRGWDARDAAFEELVGALDEILAAYIKLELTDIVSRRCIGYTEAREMLMETPKIKRAREALAKYGKGGASG